MRKIWIFLICIILIFSACSPQSGDLPDQSKTKQKTEAGEFWPSAQTGKPAQSEATSNAIQTSAIKKGGHWRFVRVACDEFKPINDAEHGTYWNGQILSNSIQAVYTITDRTNVNYPVEQRFVYNWGWNVDPLPTADTGYLYAGDKAIINLSLEYTGIDPKILSNHAEIYTGAFKNYPPDNRIIFNGPGDTGSKTVSIEIGEGLPGKEATIDIVCSGGAQSFTYRYIYEWVQ